MMHKIINENIKNSIKSVYKSLHIHAGEHFSAIDEEQFSELNKKLIET